MSHASAVHVLVFDGFADWEPAHALAELRRWGKRLIRSVGFTREPVTSMGGLRVIPDSALSEIRPVDVELLILPGGNVWESNGYPPVELERLIHALLAADKPVAAICGATVALARAGVLDERRHTSNARDYLTEHSPGYRGAAHYVDTLAVRDRHLITASGLGDVDFARAIFAELGVFSESDEQLWFDMFKHGRLPEAHV